MLKVSGAISVTNSADKKAHFDLKMLEGFPKTTIKTETPWLDGETVFEGVLLREIVNFVKGNGTQIKAVALNDYAVDIPFEDFQKYDVIVAYKSNGKYMSIRDKGPLWIIYPWSQNEELKVETYHSRSIWQLSELEIR
ncbi:molybdopterin-dependent oxidoreductase [Sneathiella sp. P13V-1]|uniref:molybdopterin-dependent oxidoreductase n=1 Tax=Sneathiella sp. P13V-1 TaxID=2697366 RepID=UPI001D0F689A|nr:molybdopterin-dependent oxidoreductase [Sneathiella sp. P13V-1]